MINKVGRFFLAKGVKFVWLFQRFLRNANTVSTDLNGRMEYLYSVS